MQECTGNKTVNSVDLPRGTILSEAPLWGTCNDYPKGVDASASKRRPPRTGDDIVSSAWQHAAAPWSGVGITNRLEDSSRSDLISNISPTDTPLTANIGVEECDGTFFEWQSQSLAAVSTTNAAIEGDDIGTYTAVTPTVRLGNYTSISRATFIVSGTDQVVAKAGRSNEKAYQAVLKARELKRDIESMALANQLAVAGSDTAARYSAGLGAWVKTNVDKGTNGVNPVYTSAATNARSDGVQRAFTETIIQNVVKDVWESGGEPSMVMVGSFNKQKLSAFSGIAAQRYMAPDGPTQIIGAADIKVGVAVQECAGNKVVNSVDLLKKTILSQASFIRGRCNDYPKGVGSSEPKRHPSRTDDDIVSSARRRVAALRSGRGLASLFEDAKKTVEIFFANATYPILGH